MENLAPILFFLQVLEVQVPEKKIERPVSVLSKEIVIKHPKIRRQFHRKDTNPSQRRGNR